MRNAADPNVFLGTTIIFPNAVAHGWASGIDVRLDVAPQHGWSGFVSYSNSRVQQAGPITGGLFLEDDWPISRKGSDSRPITISGTWRLPGCRLSVTDSPRLPMPDSRARALQLGDEDLDELEDRPGAELVDFERGRVKPRRTLDLTFSQRVHRAAGAEVSFRLSLLNVTNARWAYNFGESVQRDALRTGPHGSDWDPHHISMTSEFDPPRHRGHREECDFILGASVPQCRDRGQSG